jgi:pimeloyl-ACP methyl ester carboxylesterase
VPARGFLPVTGRPAPIRAARRAGDDYGRSALPDWREVDWQGHLHQAEIRGRRLNYVDIGSGDGPPIVFIHGLGGCWQNWLENLPRAAQSRRAIALDLPGFSESEMPADDISISGYARTVVELLREIGIDGPAMLVGNSMGGFVAAEIGIRFPDACDRILLVSAAGISTTHLRQRPLLTAARATAAVTNFFLARREALVKRPGLRHAMLGYVVRHPTRLKPEVANEIMRGTGSPGFLQALEALTGYDYSDRLGDVKCPTLIVWGDEDKLVPVGDADEYARMIPNSRKVIFRDTGHMSMLERPQTFNDLMMDFAEERPASEAPDDVADETGAVV